MLDILSKDLRSYRLQRVRTICAQQNVDLIIASVPEHIEYLSGYYPEGTAMLFSTETPLVMDPSTGKCILITSASDLPTLMDMKFEGEVYPVGGFQYAIMEDDDFSNRLRESLAYRYPNNQAALTAAVKALKPDARRIAIDESRLCRASWDAIASACPSAECTVALPLLLEIQKIKHPIEVEMIRQSTHITEDAFEAICKRITIGTSEYDIWRMFNEEVAKRGADPYFCICTIDERAAFSDTFNRPNQKVQEGSVIRFDFGCILYRRYRSDIARTVVVGKNEKAQRLYEAILAGEKKAIEAIRPGVRACDIFHIAEDTVRASGIPHYKRHHCGHGIGLATYGWPSVVPADETPLEPGMTMCIETPYYEIGWGGVQVEDTIVVTESGAEYLTKSTQELTVIEV